MIRVHLVTIIVATSYITLGLFSQADARTYLLPYAVAALLLAVVGIIDGRRPRA